MNISIRPEEEKDYRIVENLISEAFWDLYRPGCNEHLIVYKMRKLPAFVKELSYVACDNDTVAGSIVYSRAKVVNYENREFEVLCMGPIAVMPSHQGKEIGSLLIRNTIEKAGGLGFRSITIFGNPEYYQRFGFKNSEKYGIKTSAGKNFDAFLTMELFEGALDGITGRFYADEVFKIQEK